MKPKHLSILGSTGSIGRQVLDICREFPDLFTVIGLSAGTNINLLQKQIAIFRPKLVSVSDAGLARKLEQGPGNSRCEIVHGIEGAVEVATHPDTDTVVSSMVGAAGLLPTYHALKKKKDIALANKETLVMAGALIMDLARRNNVRVMPVDSEHSAVFQCLEGNNREAVRRIILTASGGPFLGYPRKKLEHVTVEEALCHPRWKMGRKITIDSATLMNKGLEVIEAHWLFGIPPEKIDIVIHPESIIHSMVEYIDGSIIAQLGVTDMKLPILYALSYPHRLEHNFRALDFTELKKLSFKQLDDRKFPCVRLAYQALQAGGIIPAVLNAANEMAVQSFLNGKIPFHSIPLIIGEVLNTVENQPVTGPGDVMQADSLARNLAKETMKQHRLTFQSKG